MDKVYTRFQTETAQKPYPTPWGGGGGGGGTYLYGFYMEVLPPVP